MDITLAKTFLAICDLGSFAKAADQLYVTQSTISMRIKQLEDMLGQSLFIRTKAGTTLTPAGSQFHPFAEKLVQTWEQACQEVALPEKFQERLSVGVQFTLWERLMIKWLPWIKQAVPDYAILAEVGSSESLMQQLVNGMLDLVITYTPQNRSGLNVEKLMSERLVMVSSTETTGGPGSIHYIFIDWGPEFKMDHAAEFPGNDMAALATNYGPLALQYLLTNGGSAYLPYRMVHPLLRDKRLYRVDKKPVFSRSVYTVSMESGDSSRFDKALEGLRFVAARKEED